MRSASPWKVALPAALCTAGIFLLLPMVDLVSQKGSNRIRVLPVDSLRAPAPPPPVLERPPVRTEPPAFTPPLPRLSAPLRRLPLRALLTVNLAQASGGGQFDAGFMLSDAVGPGLEELVFALNEIDEAPIPLVRFEPAYPARARADRIEGEVELEFVVTAAGEVSQVEVVSSRPGSMFNAAAIRAVEGWTFKPGVRGGEKVAVRVRQKVSFNLQ